MSALGRPERRMPERAARKVGPMSVAELRVNPLAGAGVLASARSRTGPYLTRLRPARRIRGAIMGALGS